MEKINKNPQKNQINYVDWIELIKFRETRNYVQRVLENYNVYRYILEQKPIMLNERFFKRQSLILKDGGERRDSNPRYKFPRTVI